MQRVVTLIPTEVEGNKASSTVTYHRSPHYNKPELGFSSAYEDSNQHSGLQLQFGEGERLDGKGSGGPMERYDVRDFWEPTTDHCKGVLVSYKCGVLLRRMIFIVKGLNLCLILRGPLVRYGKG